MKLLSRQGLRYHHSYFLVLNILPKTELLQLQQRSFIRYHNPWDIIDLWLEITDGKNLLLRIRNFRTICITEDCRKLLLYLLWRMRHWLFVYFLWVNRWSFILKVVENDLFVGLLLSEHWSCGQTIHLINLLARISWWLLLFFLSSYGPKLA